MQVKKDIMWRINGSFIIICMMSLAILFQIIRIQVVEGPIILKFADSTRLNWINISPSRGNIFSADGKLIATSIPVYDIHIDTQVDGFLKAGINKSKIDSLGSALSNLFKDRSPEVYAHDIRQAIKQKDRYFLLQRSVTYAELQKVKSFPILKLGRYKGGFCLEQKEERELPFMKLASRTIGNVREVKPVGIEAAFNDVLAGTVGKRLYKKLSGNVWMPVSEKDEIESKDGNDVISTLDINIQGVAESSLERQLIAQNADRGCAVLMEVETGEIKAIANLSKTKDGNYIEDFNYVISQSTEPGSTMKMASILAALDDGLVEPDDSIDVGSGSCWYSGHEMKDAHPPHRSRLSVQEVFETSSNVGVSKIIRAAYAKNPQAFINKLKSFGLASKLNLQIAGERSPFVKDTGATWSALSLPWISIGYESRLTPLQMLTFYNAIANNGRMVKPRLVKEIQYHGQLIKSFPVEVLRDSIASPSAIKKAKKMLEGVVQNGTATSLKSPNYRIAGKTGTAQMSKDNLGYNKSDLTYQASFVGYFPADAPKYSCIVVVYSPSNSLYYGGAVAAPVFKEIADKVYSNHLEINTRADKKDSSIHDLPLVKAGYQKDLKKILYVLDIPLKSGDEEAEIVSSSTAEKNVSFKERKISTVIVPDVRGMGAKDAISILENAGLKVNCSGRGSVISQSINPGTPIDKKRIIEVELGI